MEPNRVTASILHAAMKVHSALGPGLMESAYRGCVRHELTKMGLQVHAEIQLPIKYDGVTIDVGYRIDLMVEDVVVVELKAVEKLLRVHEAQILSYLKLSQRPIGLLINFHVPRLRTGIKRFVNGAAAGIDIKRLPP
jgi:GxxExxY protein